MISIIIPTHNGTPHPTFPHLPRQLALLRKQSMPGEIILLDSSARDGLDGVAEENGAKIIKVKKNEFDHGGSRTLGGKLASQETIVYMTHDAMPADDRCLEKLIAPFSQDEKIAIVYGRQLPHENASPCAAHLRYFNYPDRSHARSLEDRSAHGIRTVFLSNAFAAYRRDALQEIGWFKENLILCEDVHAGAKMLLRGYKIAYAADACVYHSHNYSMKKEFKRYFDIGVFHQQENWILREFGAVRGEGNKYLKSGLFFLMKKGSYHRIPEFMMRSAAKYIAYQLGRKNKLLPRAMAQKMSMNANWWNA